MPAQEARLAILQNRILLQQLSVVMGLSLWVQIVCDCQAPARARQSKEMLPSQASLWWDCGSKQASSGADPKTKTGSGLQKYETSPAEGIWQSDQCAGNGLRKDDRFPSPTDVVQPQTSSPLGKQEALNRRWRKRRRARKRPGTRM